MTTHGVAPFPLYWPLQHPRTKFRGSARFSVDFVTARTGLLGELQRLGASDVVLSSNVPIRRDGLPAVPDREPDDPGVAVYFSRWSGGRMQARRPFVIACDQFSKVRWNLRAIGATIEALRSIERHGTTSMLEQAFSGFAALPAPSEPNWRDTLGVGPSAGPDDVRAAYRELVREQHPDAGGDTHRMARINGAYETGLRELGVSR